MRCIEYVWRISVFAVHWWICSRVTESWKKTAKLLDSEGRTPKSDIYSLPFWIARTFCQRGQKRRLCECKCRAVWMEQHETAAAAYVRWIFSFHFLQALLLFAQVHLLLVAQCPPSVACLFVDQTSSLFFSSLCSSVPLYNSPTSLSVSLYPTDIFKFISLLFHFVFLHPFSSTRPFFLHLILFFPHLFSTL